MPPRTLISSAVSSRLMPLNVTSMPKTYYFICFQFFYSLATPRGMWDLSCLTRDRTRAACSGNAVLTTERPGKSLTPYSFSPDLSVKFSDLEPSSKFYLDVSYDLKLYMFKTCNIFVSSIKILDHCVVRLRLLYRKSTILQFKRNVKFFISAF